MNNALKTTHESKTTPSPIRDLAPGYNTAVLSHFLSWLRNEKVMTTAFLRQGIALRGLEIRECAFDGIIALNKFPKNSKRSDFESHNRSNPIDDKIWVSLKQLSCVSTQTSRDNKVILMPEQLVAEMIEASNENSLGQLFVNTLKNNGKTIHGYLERGKKKIYEVVAFDDFSMLCRNDMGSHELVLFHALTNIAPNMELSAFEKLIEDNQKNVAIDSQLFDSTQHQF